MSVDPQQPMGPPSVMTPVDPGAVTQELLRAIQSAAQMASGSQDAREVQECGAAALSFAQAIISLDPTRLAGGATPEAQAAANAVQNTPAPQQKPPIRDGNRNGIIGA